MRRLALTFLAMSPVLASSAGQTYQPQQVGSVSGASNIPSSYCGMYSLYYAARALGHDISFQDLLKPQYISSRKGSSLDDLIRATKDQGLHAEPLGRMSCAMLRHASCPVILHVKNDMARTEDYNHWILFAGVESGKARIYDGVHPVQLVDFPDLAARWDGVGLLVADAPVSASFLWLVYVAQFVFYAGACGGAIALLLWLHRYWISRARWRRWASGWQRGACEFAALLALALVLGIGFRWVHAEGFLSHPPAIAAIQDRHLGGFLSKVKVEDVPKLMHADGVTIVDARYPQDFLDGHLADAINIPPDSSPEQCQKALAGVSASNRILLYCQSNGCPYSEIVARNLIALGYSKIIYFRDGWTAWQNYQRNTGL